MLDQKQASEFGIFSRSARTELRHCIKRFKGKQAKGKLRPHQDNRDSRSLPEAAAQWQRHSPRVTGVRRRRWRRERRCVVARRVRSGGGGERESDGARGKRAGEEEEEGASSAPPVQVRQRARAGVRRAGRWTEASRETDTPVLVCCRAFVIGPKGVCNLTGPTSNAWVTRASPFTRLHKFTILYFGSRY